MSRLLCVALAWGWISLGSLQAHQPDTSYLTIRLGAAGIDTVFASDVTTLQRLFPGLDADHDGSINRDEGEASRPVVETYLREHLFLDIDGQEATWGDARPLQWPTPDLSPIPEAEWHQLLLQYPFRLPRETLPGDVQVTCDVFIELGLTHKILGDLLIEDQVKHPVIFTLEEPDYRFDVRHALAKASMSPPASPALPGAAPRQLVRRGIESTTRPTTFFLLLVLLVAAPPRRAAGLVAVFALGQLLTAMPLTLVGLPLAARWIQLSQPIAVMLTAAGNLCPRPSPQSQTSQLSLGVGVGMIQGFAVAAVSRESCLFPLQPVQCLGSFQAGAAVGLISSAVMLAGTLAFLGAWRPGSIMPRVISMAVLICGAGLFF